MSHYGVGSNQTNNERVIAAEYMKVDDDVEELHEPICLVDRPQKEIKDESKKIAIARFYRG